MENRPEGFETEVGLFYFKAGNLNKVIERMESLVQTTTAVASTSATEVKVSEAKQAGTADEDAVQALSKGGAIMLGRTLKSLQTILEAEEKKI